VPRQPALLARPAGNGVFLVGFMGAGKSSVGLALSERLNWAFEDLDDRIERRERRTVAEIFRESGEPAFRRAESAALEQALQELRCGAVKIIALGGGAFVQKSNAAMLKNSGALTVFLDAPVEELWRRCCEQAANASAGDAGVGKAGTERPLLKSLEQFRKLYAARRKNYMTASLVVDTAGRTIEAIAAAIAKKMGFEIMATRAQPRTQQEEGEVE
jgi:shikimate kinase